MGRGHGGGVVAGSDGGRGERRQAREFVRKTYGPRLEKLSKADRYRIGDVSRRLLLAFSVDVDEPSQLWEPRLRALLPERAQHVLDNGLGGALIRDGVEPLPSVQQLLVQGIVGGLRARDADRRYDEALTSFRRLAFERRNAELEWLRQHLQLPPVVTDRPWDQDATRALLTRIWVERARPHRLVDLIDEVDAGS